MKRLQSLATLGHVIAAALMTGFIYLAWGSVFEPGGIGSNVVLGLLLALAMLYLGATNLGPVLDDALASKERRAVRRQLRQSDALIDEVALALKKEKKLGADAKAALQEKLTATVAARAAAAPPGKALPSEAQLSTLAKSTADLEATATEALDAVNKGQGGLLMQARGLGLAFAAALALRAFFVAPFQIPSGSMIPTLLIGDHLFVFRGMYGLQNPFSGEPSYMARWALPTPGDVVVFEAPPWVPQNAGEDWIKRVIAGAGQTVKMVSGTVVVDDKPYTLVGTGDMVRYMDFQEGLHRWSERQASGNREDVAGHVHDVFYDIPPRTTDWPIVGVPRDRYTGLECRDGACTVKDGFVFVMGDNRDNSSDGRVWGAVPVDNIKGKALFIWMSVDGSQRSVDLGRFTLPRFRWDRLFDSII